MGRGLRGIHRFVVTRAADGADQNRRNRAFLFVRFLLLLLALQALSQSAQPQPAAEDLEWVERNIAAARNQVMPMGVDKPEQLQWQAAAYRSSKDRWTDRAESYFSIDRVYPDRSRPNRESFVATVTTLVGGLPPRQLRGITRQCASHQAHRRAMSCDYAPNECAVGNGGRVAFEALTCVTPCRS